MPQLLALEPAFVPGGPVPEHHALELPHGPRQPDAIDILAPRKDGKSPRAHASTKLRAINMDESLAITKEMRQQVEHLRGRQQEAAKKMKDGKANLTKLQEQVKSLEGQIKDAEAERDATRKSHLESKSQMDRLAAEHEGLTATHTWTKSSLDSALLSQEQYQKGYASLLAAFKKTKAELARTAAAVEEHRTDEAEVATARSNVTKRTDELEGQLKRAQNNVQKIRTLHYARAEAIVDRMLVERASASMQHKFQAWAKMVGGERAIAEQEKAQEVLQHTIKRRANKTKKDATNLLNRLSVVGEKSLMMMVVRNWSHHLQQVQKDRAATQKVQSMMREHKEEAIRFLERGLAASAMDLLLIIFADWASQLCAARQTRESKAEADAELKAHQSRKRDEAFMLARHVLTQRDRALMLHAMRYWIMHARNARATHVHDSEVKAKVNKLEAEITALRANLDVTIEDLEEVTEELQASQQKNLGLKEQFRNIMALQQNIDESISELERDADG